MGIVSIQLFHIVNSSCRTKWCPFYPAQMFDATTIVKMLESAMAHRWYVLIKTAIVLVLCLGHEGDKLRHSRPLPLREAVQRGDYRKYDIIGSADACSGWIKPHEWQRRIYDSKDPFSRRVHTGGDPHLHCLAFRRKTSCAWHRKAAWRPAFPIVLISWLQLCQGDDICRASN